jgi:uncharacterized protein (TIGR02266 family)
MSEYWIMDEQGRILGPIGLHVLRDLGASGRLKETTQVSQDRSRWTPLSQHAELKRLVTTTVGAEQRAADRQQAQRLLLKLEQMRGQSNAVIFGVPDGATLSEHRNAFLAMAKTYHPARLRKGVDPSLEEASRAMFQFLGDRMQALEKLLAPTPLPATASAPRPSHKPLKYGIDDFLGLERRAEDRIEAKVKVTFDNVGMFTDHKLVNLSMGGVFIASTQVLNIGSRVDLTFKFDGTSTEIKTQGTVVYENTGNDPRNAHGFGVRFGRLENGDRQFIQEFIQDALRSPRR